MQKMFDTSLPNQPKVWYECMTSFGKMLTHLPPIDSSTIDTWVNSCLERTRIATEYGFGLGCDGSEHDLQNFLANTAGEVPWTSKEVGEFYRTMLQHPNLDKINQDFDEKYGIVPWPRNTLEDLSTGVFG